MPTNIVEHGAREGSDFVNTQAIQAAIDHVGATGGRVVVPAGIWRTGTIWLRSGVDLHLMPQAVLMGTNNPADYPPYCPAGKGHAVSRRAFDRRMVFGCDLTDVSITGMGSIDGAGGCADHEFERGPEGRPANLQFVNCRNVTVRDIHLRQAGSWMQQYLACEELFIHNIRVWNHGNPTNDGLDIDGCRDVRISHCDIDSHDDALVFKSTGPKQCRDIVVTGCRLRSHCHGIKFGTESVGGFENIRIADCLISDSRLPMPLEGYPHGRPVITGCALECVDGGTMRMISISGLVIENVFAPIFIKLGNRHHRDIPGENFEGCGILEDIHISNIIARSAGPFTCSITGYPGHPVRRVHINDISIEHRGGVTADEILPVVPENSTAYPEINMFEKASGKHLPAWGFYIRHAEDVRLSGLKLRLLAQDARKAIVTEAFRGVVEEEDTAFCEWNLPPRVFPIVGTLSDAHKEIP